MSDRNKQVVVEEGMVRLVLVNMNIQGTLNALGSAELRLVGEEEGSS